MHKHNAIFNKTVTKIVTILTKSFFSYLNPTSYLKREYPEKLIENEMRNVTFCEEGTKKVKRVKDIISFAVMYHPQLKKFRKSNKSKLLFIKYE